LCAYKCVYIHAHAQAYTVCMYIMYVYTITTMKLYSVVKPNFQLNYVSRDLQKWDKFSKNLGFNI